MKVIFLIQKALISVYSDLGYPSVIIFIISVHITPSLFKGSYDNIKCADSDMHINPHLYVVLLHPLILCEN